MTIRHVLADRQGGSAAEFALVLPILLLFLLGTIDAGRLVWEYNQAEKATQMGARLLTVTTPLASGLSDASYVGTAVNGATLTQGDRIPKEAFGQIRCTSTGCTCVTNPCPAVGTFDPSGVFTNILLERMQDFKPEITAANVIVEYSGSGLGYAGDPNGMEIAPLVTVRLQNQTFQPISTFIFGSTPITMPEFKTTLTSEDASGTVSN